MNPSSGSPVPSEHETVGAYALGILDDAEATAFEAHLAGCEWCAQQLDELAGMEPMLAALADLPGSGSSPAIGESLSAKPSPRLVEKLVDEVAEKRAQKRRRSFYMIAAAAALIIAGPLAAVAVNSGSGGGQVTASAAQTTFESMPDRKSATDPASQTSATIAMQQKDWGTQAVLELKNAKGPLKCSLVLVAKNGQRVTMSSWSVPNWGYGIPDGKTPESRKPLYIGGAAAFKPNEIDHFEVVTFQGKKLVQVQA
ncbi:anti-sigma factor family protein [Streptomyces puniciscabiei]|uniref:anti-sigma factor family protein n=1 Tax=Streptomyces puniciscabiei TaxID=164348 RepID=UPI001F1E85F6|nr:zf-HC2 domain-containing protein [Streptomyces puniciscabiei]